MCFVENRNDPKLDLKPNKWKLSNSASPDDYDDLIDWHELNPELKSSKMGYPTKNNEDREDEREGVRIKERWAYVKVNMEGVIVGRKICIIEDMDYSSLALQLEDMFGRY